MRFNDGGFKFGTQPAHAYVVPPVPLNPAPLSHLIRRHVQLTRATRARRLFNQFAGEVPQADFHWAFLTCRETITLAAVSTLPVSHRLIPLGGATTHATS